MSVLVWFTKSSYQINHYSHVFLVTEVHPLCLYSRHSNREDGGRGTVFLCYSHSSTVTSLLRKYCSLSLPPGSVHISCSYPILSLSATWIEIFIQIFFQEVPILRPGWLRNTRRSMPTSSSIFVQKNLFRPLPKSRLQLWWIQFLWVVFW